MIALKPSHPNGDQPHDKVSQLFVANASVCEPAGFAEAVKEYQGERYAKNSNIRRDEVIQLMGVQAKI